MNNENERQRNGDTCGGGSTLEFDIWLTSPDLRETRNGMGGWTRANPFFFSFFFSVLCKETPDCVDRIALLKENEGEKGKKEKKEKKMHSQRTALCRSIALTPAFLLWPPPYLRIVDMSVFPLHLQG
jgi:hypothetical protein